MATHDECGRLLRRATRDLQAPMALLVAAHPRRMVVAHRGFEDAAALRVLLAVDHGQVRQASESDRGETSSVRSWAAASVQHDGLEVGTLFVADRRRRWFDHDEVRHLGLMTFLAGPLIAELAPTMVDAVDVRERIAALAHSGSA